MKNFLYFLLIFIIISCSAPRVIFDYDKKAGFENYKTYNYYPELKTGLSQLDDKRIFYQIDSIFKVKGFRKSDTPDFYINIVAGEFLSSNRNNVGIGIGGTGRNVGVGISGGIPIGGPQKNQEIIFDLIDIKENELIWQANSTAVVREKSTPDQKEEYFRKVIAKVFKRFPPEKK